MNNLNVNQDNKLSEDLIIGKSLDNKNIYQSSIDSITTYTYGNKKLYDLIKSLIMLDIRREYGYNVDTHINMIKDDKCVEK